MLTTILVVYFVIMGVLATVGLLLKTLIGVYHIIKPKNTAKADYAEYVGSVDNEVYSPLVNEADKDTADLDLIGY